MKTRWVLVISLLSLALGSCGRSQTVIEDSSPPAPLDKNIVPPITSTATTTTTTTGVTITSATPNVVETGAWKTYHNVQAGYSAEYPADWAVSEQVGTDGSIVTTFSSVDGGAGIMVLVQSGEFGGAGSLDLPNTRCEEVTIGGLTGTRCFDTLSSSTSTAVVSQGKTYMITSTSKRLDPMIYDRFLDSFQFSQ